jgi:hypothetical protein
MDFTKFVSMLESSCLYFARADRLGDPFEGSYSRANVAMRPQVYEDSPGLLRLMPQMNEWVREWTYINCWHQNEQESAAMWRLYAKSEEAVAIQSTYSVLADCLPECAFIGAVEYIDYAKDWLPEGNTFFPFMHKRKSFEHEREVRAVIHELPVTEDQRIPMGKRNTSFGRQVPIEPAVLIKNVYVAPTASDWFHDLVQRVSKRYGQSWPVQKSCLDAQPVY